VITARKAGDYLKYNKINKMPQFDKITFFNQLFWLFVFFSVYYLLLLKVFLPKLSAVLKARSKKLKKGSDGVLTFTKEKQQASVSFNNSVEQMSNVVKNALSTSAVKTNAWVDSSLRVINKNELDKGNRLMETSLYKQSVASFLLANLKVK